MQKEMNDFIVEIIQDFDEIYSLLKVLKDSISNENSDISSNDITNTLEISISKMHSTKKSLNKYVEMTIK